MLETRLLSERQPTNQLPVEVIMQMFLFLFNGMKFKGKTYMMWIILLQLSKLIGTWVEIQVLFVISFKYRLY